MLLVQRPEHVSKMAGMWELPEIAPDSRKNDNPVLQVRHSITDTDYRVSVFAISEDRLAHHAARWFTSKQCERLALTGLTRKILRRIAAASPKKIGVSN